jgi:hypothetical protein
VLRFVFFFCEGKKNTTRKGQKEEKFHLLYSSLLLLRARESALSLARQTSLLFSASAVASFAFYKEREREREKKKEGNIKHDEYDEKKRSENLLGKTNFSVVRSPLVERAAPRPARHDE